jgi:hypothetical protein
MKIKIFRSCDDELLQEAINKWLSLNDVSVFKIIQSESKLMTISIFYKEVKINE